MNRPATALAHEAGPFAADGEHPAGGGPFLLAGEGVWLVRGGVVDVFAVCVADDHATGRRTHLFRAGAADVLFGAGPAPAAGAPAGWQLLAVPAVGAQVVRAPQARLRALAGSLAAGEVAELVDRWVNLVAASLAREAVPPAQPFVELNGESPLHVGPQTLLRPRDGVRWVRHTAGRSLLFGHASLAVTGTELVPVSRHAWLEASDAAQLSVTTTEAALADGTAWAGLARLHDFVLRGVGLVVERTDHAQRLRIQRKAEANRSAVRLACDALVRPLRPTPRAGGASPAGAAESGPAQDALLAAARIVGRALGLDVRAYAVADGAPPPRDPLAAIARASRFRTRRVALRDTWWTCDNGPLLASRAEGGHPVALLPAGADRYELHDPRGGAREPVTPAVAESLALFAHTFYRPFPTTPLTIRDVVGFGVRGCSRDLNVVLATSLAAAALGLLPSWTIGKLFNDVVPGAERGQLLQLTLVLVVTAVATGMFGLARSIALLRVEGIMGNAIQTAVWDRLLSLPMPFFRPYTAGELANRAMGIDGIRQVVAGTTVTAIIGGIMSLSNFFLMFWYSTRLAWWATLLIGIALLVTGLGSYLQLRHQREVSTLQSKVSGLVLQLLTSVAKLRVTGAEANAFAAWAAPFSRQRRLQFRVRTVGNWVAAFNAAYPVVCYMVIFAVGEPLVTGSHAIRTGDFLAFVAAFVSCLTNTLLTSTALLMSLNVVPLYELARPILVAQPEVDDAKSDPGALVGDIEIQNAHFRYHPDAAPVLRGFTLHVRAGEYVALVGGSGSGKSTVLRLLLGFESPEAGSIYFDGQDLGGLDVQAVRRQIGVVLQNGRLMSGDLFTNIVGSANATMDDAWEAARMAGFDDDVRAMPMGMHTVVSEGGGTLSGGQRQRLLIARAIVHRPRVLVFDEATSALDNRTQAIVTQSLDRLQATRIVVAHRLSTILHADRICVVDRGVIAESGTYDDLLVRDGLFASLARRQLA